MDKYYIIEWPNSQKWIDMVNENDNLNIRLIDEQAVAVECSFYDMMESTVKSQDRTKSRRQIFEQYFRVLGLIVEKDGGLKTKIMRKRADRILDALDRYKDKLESTGRYKVFYEMYKAKYITWEFLSNVQFSRTEYFA